MSARLLFPEISGAIIGAFFDVYNDLGFGFLESIYARALEEVLRDRGLGVEREFPLVVRFRGRQIGFHRCDMVVNRIVIVESKAGELLPPIAHAQLRNYLAASGLELGMLLHFGPKAIFRRVLGPRIHPAVSEESGSRRP